MSHTKPHNDVDLFIERLGRRELVIRQAPEIQLFQNGKEVTFGSVLADAIHDYSLRGKPAYWECRKWITYAYTHGLVIDGPRTEEALKEKSNRIADLEQKLLDLQREYDALAEENAKLADDDIAWQNKHRECKENYEALLNSFKGKGQIDP